MTAASLWPGPRGRRGDAVQRRRSGAAGRARCRGAPPRSRRSDVSMAMSCDGWRALRGGVAPAAVVVALDLDAAEVGQDQAVEVVFVVVHLSVDRRLAAVECLGVVEAALPAGREAELVEVGGDARVDLAVRALVDGECAAEDLIRLDELACQRRARAEVGQTGAKLHTVRTVEALGDGHAFSVVRRPRWRRTSVEGGRGRRRDGHAAGGRARRDDLAGRGGGTTAAAVRAAGRPAGRAVPGRRRRAAGGRRRAGRDAQLGAGQVPVVRDEPDRRRRARGPALVGRPGAARRPSERRAGIHRRAGPAPAGRGAGRLAPGQRFGS